MKTIVPISLGELSGVMPLTSGIQDAKRAAIQGKPSRWPDRMGAEFDQLEARAKSNPYVALDLAYLRDPTSANRPFAYIVTYDTFISPERDATGAAVSGTRDADVSRATDRRDSRLRTQTSSLLRLPSGASARPVPPVPRSRAGAP